MTDALFEAFADPPDNVALRFGDRSLTYAELRGAAARVAADVAGMDRVAVWALPDLETAVAVVGALAAGVPIVAINPKAGSRELDHVLADAAPSAVLAGPAARLPDRAAARRLEVDVAARATDLPEEPDGGAPAIIVYTSGTTGPPKGAVLPRRALSSNLDALAAAWEWTADDVVAHALPLFHVHGLILGTLGPLRRGGTALHLGRFSEPAVAEALGSGAATMLFAVPTMYRRLADAAEAEPAIGRAVGRARLLVSGSAALPAAEHERLRRLTGQAPIERYGMTETLMNTAVRAGDEPRPGYVGRPLDGVEVRLLADDGTPLEVDADETVGEVAVRGPNLFLGYLNRPDATAAAMRDGWFSTGDLATRAADGAIRLVGRRATDLIKSGGFKLGAGEIEGALLEHGGVEDVAVTGEPDADLGERVVAWVVCRPNASPSERELIDHVAALLTPHKRPRVVRFVETLPRNELGKVQKARLRVPGSDDR